MKNVLITGADGYIGELLLFLLKMKLKQIILLSKIH